MTQNFGGDPKSGSGNFYDKLLDKIFQWVGQEQKPTILLNSLHKQGGSNIS